MNNLSTFKRYSGAFRKANAGICHATKEFFNNKNIKKCRHREIHRQEKLSVRSVTDEMLYLVYLIKQNFIDCMTITCMCPF